jgi:hypothetical protein
MIRQFHEFFKSHSMQVSQNSNSFRFRLCQEALHIQNLSNRWRYKYDPPISRIFRISFFKFLQIQIASVSGYVKHYIIKICQIVAGISMIRHFHDFF